MVSRHIIPGLTLLLTVHYTNVLSVHIILAIITFVQLVFRDGEIPGVGSNLSEAAWVP